MVSTPPELPPLIGERGTGKELIATRLHFLSRRWDRPFTQINCAALPETLLESELFGHEAGAFTGAVRRRVGRFELADTGSLFLDEVANASLQAQEKVLRAVEYGEFERVGGNTTLTVDVRVIAATNADLPLEAAAGRFRHDLLDRLAFDVLTVPPLRARRDDVPVLAAHFGGAIARELGWLAYRGFAPAALEALVAYDWPGNVRELRNVVGRAVYRARRPGAPIVEVDFDPFASPYRPKVPAAPPASPPPAPATGAGEAEAAVGAAAEPFDLRASMAGIERRAIERALARNRHNQRATARHLGLTYDQLRNRLKKHGLLEGARRAAPAARSSGTAR